MWSLKLAAYSQNDISYAFEVMQDLFDSCPVFIPWIGGKLDNFLSGQWNIWAHHDCAMI